MTIRGRKKQNPSKPKYRESKSSKPITIRLPIEIYNKLLKMQKKTGYTPHDYLKRRIEYDMTRKHGTRKRG